MSSAPSFFATVVLAEHLLERERGRVAHDADANSSRSFEAVGVLPEKIADHFDTVEVLSEKIANRPEAIEVFPEKIADRFEAVGVLPEKIADRFETVGGLLEKVADRFETVGGFPEKIADRFEAVGVLLEKATDRSEAVGVLLEKITERFEALGGASRDDHGSLLECRKALGPDPRSFHESREEFDDCSVTGKSIEQRRRAHRPNRFFEAASLRRDFDVALVERGFPDAVKKARFTTAYCAGSCSRPRSR